MGIPQYVYLAAMGFMGLVTLFLYVSDKNKAKKNKWRTPEKILLLSSFLFGSIGGLIGMYGFRHKTKHWYFVVVNVGSFIIHIALGIYVFMYL